MKYIIITLSLLFSPGAWAQSYICEPVQACFLSEGNCEEPPSNEGPLVIKVWEKTVTLLEADVEVASMQILEVIESAGITSYFGIIDFRNKSFSHHTVITVLDTGSMFLFSASLKKRRSAVLGELKCEVPLPNLDAEQEILGKE